MLSCDWLQHHDDADRGDRGVPGGGAAAVHHDRAAHHLLQVRAAAASLVRPHVLCLQRPQRLPGLQPGG